MLLKKVKISMRVMVCGLLAIWPLHFAGAEPWLRSSQRWLGEPGTIEVTERQSVTAQAGNAIRVVSLRVPGLIASAGDTAAGDFTRFSIPGAGVSQPIGQPELPVYRKLLCFDRDARVSLKASVTSAREFVLKEHGLPPRLFPSQRPIPKVPGAMEVSGIKVREASGHGSEGSAGMQRLQPGLSEQQAESRLQVGAPPPSEEVPAARLVDLGIARGRRVVLLEVFPVSYEAEAGSVTLRESIEVEILAEDSPDAAKNNPAHEPGSRSGVSAERRKLPLSQWRRSAEPPLRQGSEIESANAAAKSPPIGWGEGKSDGDEPSISRLLIIATEQFVPRLGNFVTHKEALGWTVDLLDTATTGATAGAIRSQIHARYTTEISRPTHLLLVGDTDTIPAWGGKGAYLPATDLYYACMDGTNDWLPDMAYGLFPARTAAQLTNMIAKTIAYENLITSQTPFVRNAVFITSQDNHAITEGTHNLVVTQHLSSLGYVSQKLYRHSYGATTATVTNSINAGCSLLAFSGHGLHQKWLDPLVHNSDVLALTNELRLPFVMSFACDTGAYRDYDESFAEAWLRTAGSGAVAVLASSEDSYWYEDDVSEQAVFAAMFEDRETAIGDIILGAKERYLAHYGPGSETLQYFEQYNLFGDPTLQLVVLGATKTSPLMLGTPAFLPDGSLQFTMIGNIGQTLEVQVSTNLVHWTPLATMVTTNAVMPFRDTTAVDHGRRFYRVRLYEP